MVKTYQEAPKERDDVSRHNYCPSFRRHVPNNFVELLWSSPIGDSVRVNLADGRHE